MIILEILLLLISIVSLCLIMNNHIKNKTIFFSLFCVIIIISVLILVFVGLELQLWLLFAAIVFIIIL